MDILKKGADPAPPTLPPDLDLMIEDWVREHFHNSVVSQTPEVFNKVRVGVNALKAKLAAHLTK